MMPLRVLQLDLANQPETLEGVRAFTDLAVRCGYNILALHLKGIVRTRSFPYTDGNPYYTPQAMQAIVEYAARRKIEVVPIVETFGHAEQILRFPQFQHLAELRGGRMGRFSSVPRVFCPSLKETYAFLEQYLSEIAELFPSAWFHAGCDEVWDIGYCDLCKARLETETQSDLYAKHLLAIHGIVAGKLKKRMIIWDDMFDLYPRALAGLPRDVALCSWHYDKFVDRPCGHTGGPKADVFARYDRLGFRYFFAPASFSLRNVESFTDYARARSPLGGWLTLWGGVRKSDYPVIAYAGLAWSGRGKRAPAAALQDRAVRAVTGFARKDLASLVKFIVATRAQNLPAAPQAYLCGPLSDREYDRKLVLEAAQSALEAALPETAGAPQRDVVEDLALGAAEELLYYELRELMTALYRPSVPPRERTELARRIERCRGRIRALKAKRRRQWDRHRSGIQPGRTNQPSYDALIAMLARAPAEAQKTKALLKLACPSGGAPFEVLARFREGGEWVAFASGSAGPPGCAVPLRSKTIPKAIRLEIWGHVGLALAFVELDTGAARYVPASFGAVEGRVVNPTALLEEGRPDNGDYCLMGDGELDAREKFCHPYLSRVRHVLEINLKKQAG